MHVLVFGASGQTGARVVEACLARGARVSAFVRSPARFAARDGVSVVGGDARDDAAVRDALAGVDAVLCCLGMHDISVPATDFSDSVRTIVGAMKIVGPRRIVAIASAGVLDPPAGGYRNKQGLPDYLKYVSAEHVRNYETVRSSGLDWTLMCPVFLKDDIAPGRARWAFDDLPGGSAETSVADLAATMVELIARPDAVGRRVGIVSDRS
jgi:putative NADH-flavin reductase